jgi:hypothetical protein
MDKHSESQGFTRHKFLQMAGLSLPDTAGTQNFIQGQILARGGIDNKDEIREKTIRVRKWTYDQLRDIGKMGMEFDDAITKLNKDCKERHK